MAAASDDACPGSDLANTGPVFVSDDHSHARDQVKGCEKGDIVDEHLPPLLFKFFLGPDSTVPDLRPNVERGLQVFLDAGFDTESMGLIQAGNQLITNDHLSRKMLNSTKSIAKEARTEGFTNITGVICF